MGIFDLKGKAAVVTGATGALGGSIVRALAAKGGIISMTRDLAALPAPFGVFVNAISPGGFRHGTSGLFAERYADKTPLGHMGYTETDLQGAVVFLANRTAGAVKRNAR
jgi:NAD(P)-dependent dehydrogenase (short-subunit alcohol dehydrogenase family)